MTTINEIAIGLQEYGVQSSEIKQMDLGGKLSTMFDISESPQHCRIVVKTEPVDEFAHQLCSKMSLFDREKNFYEMASKWDTKNFIIPKWFQDSAEDVRMIALEHLGSKGYTSSPLENPLSSERAAECMKALAAFHLITFKKHKPKPYELHSESKLLFSELLDMGITDLRDRKFVPENIIAKIESSRMNIGNSVLPLTTSNCNENDLICLIHGDFWLPNVMLSDSSAEIALIDFQWVMSDSPAVDIFIFLFTSLSAEVRRKHFNELLSCYYREFGCEEFSPAILQRAAYRTVLLMIAGGVDLFVDTTAEVEERCREALLDLAAFL